MLNITLISLTIIFSTVLGNQLICDGNRFKYISSYALGRQSDLTNTFTLL